MPITPFLHGPALDPEHTKAMGVAFEKARAALGLADMTDRMIELVAREIIARLQQGYVTRIDSREE